MFSEEKGCIDTSMKLTDEQYLRLLGKIRDTVNAPDFTPNCYDSTQIGNKYTESNCGLCNENFTDADMALFPDEYPRRKSMKYRQEHHACPFDNRLRGTQEEVDNTDFNLGCFYHCYLFQSGRAISKGTKKQVVRQMVEDYITKLEGIIEDVAKELTEGGQGTGSDDNSKRD